MSRYDTAALCVFGLMLIAPACSAETAQEFTYDSKGKRDPFLPVGVKGSASPAAASPRAFLLEGIIYDPEHGSLAVINGGVLREGDVLGTYRVEKIEKTVVTLRGEEQTVDLHLPLASANTVQESRGVSDKKVKQS